MLEIVLAMLPALLIAVGVLAYVAFPYRGVRLPVAPGLGEAVRRAIESLPALDPEDDPDPALPGGATGPESPVRR